MCNKYIFAGQSDEEKDYFYYLDNGVPIHWCSEQYFGIGKIKVPGEVIQVASGAVHTLFLTTSGEVYGTGRNDSGQLGFLPSNKQLGLQKIGIIDKIDYIECGDLFSIVISKKEEAFTFGHNFRTLVMLSLT